MQVVILAGGLASRLGSLTLEQPKSMVRILGKPFLEYQLEILRRGGIRDIVLCIGHLGEQIESHFEDGSKFGINIRYSYEGEELLGTAGALKKAERLLEDPFFTMYGDSYLFLDFATIMSYFESQNKPALMTVYENRGRYDRSNAAVEGKLVKKFSKQEKTNRMVYIEYGVNIFKKEVLNMVPAGEYYSLDDLFPRLIERQELLAFEADERFYEIGSLRGLQEFGQFINGRVQ